MTVKEPLSDQPQTSASPDEHKAVHARRSRCHQSPLPPLPLCIDTVQPAEEDHNTYSETDSGLHLTPGDSPATDGDGDGDGENSGREQPWDNILQAQAPSVPTDLDFSGRPFSTTKEVHAQHADETWRTLRTLSLADTGINRLNHAFEEALGCLDHLDLSGNALRPHFWSSAVGTKTLLRITHLELKRCGLEDFPEQICHMRDLRILVMSHNSISDIPDNIGGLRDLRVLDLSFTKLLWLSPNLDKMLPSLKTLNVAGNQLFGSPAFRDIRVISDENPALDHSGPHSCPLDSHPDTATEHAETEECWPELSDGARDRLAPSDQKINFLFVPCMQQPSLLKGLETPRSVKKRSPTKGKFEDCEEDPTCVRENPIRVSRARRLTLTGYSEMSFVNYVRPRLQRIENLLKPPVEAQFEDAEKLEEQEEEEEMWQW